MKDILIKKPVQQRSRAKFLAVLEALPRVFERWGYKKTTASRLATEANISIGSFYDYFSCKEAVYIAYVDYYLCEALDQVAIKANKSRRDADQTLRELIATGIDFALEHRPVIKVILTEFPQAIQFIRLSESQQQLSKIAGNFAQHIDSALTKKPAETVIYMLGTLVMGFQFRIILAPDGMPEKNILIEELAGIIGQYIFRQ